MEASICSAGISGRRRRLRRIRFRGGRITHFRWARGHRDRVRRRVKAVGNVPTQQHHRADHMDCDRDRRGTPIGAFSLGSLTSVRGLPWPRYRSDPDGCQSVLTSPGKIASLIKRQRNSSPPISPNNAKHIQRDRVSQQPKIGRDRAVVGLDPRKRSSGRFRRKDRDQRELADSE